MSENKIRSYNEIAEDVMDELLNYSSARDLIATYTIYEQIAGILGIQLKDINEYSTRKSYEYQIINRNEEDPVINAFQRLPKLCKEKKPKLDEKSYCEMRDLTIELLHHRRLLQLGIASDSTEDIRTLIEYDRSAYALRQFYKMMQITFEDEFIHQILEAVYQDRSAIIEC